MEIPLFPLNTVLMPGLPLPLHIFEERYKLMIRQCLESNAPFGVVLIKEGKEVGEPAVPFEVGTTARIVQVERLEQGRMNLLTTGEKRFRILELTEQVPYLKGKVQYLSEEDGGSLVGVVEKVQELFGEYLKGLAGLRGGWVRQAKVPQDPGLLSYAIAQFLELPNKLRQVFLEVPSTRERLEQELPLLQRGVVWVKEELVKRTPYQGPKLN